MCYILPQSVVFLMDYSTNSGAKIMLVGNWYMYITFHDKITVVKSFFSGENHRGMCNDGKYIYAW